MGGRCLPSVPSTAARRPTNLLTFPLSRVEAVCALRVLPRKPALTLLSGTKPWLPLLLAVVLLPSLIVRPIAAFPKTAELRRFEGGRDLGAPGGTSGFGPDADEGLTTPALSWRISERRRSSSSFSLASSSRSLRISSSYGSGKLLAARRRRPCRETRC